MKKIRLYKRLFNLLLCFVFVAMMPATSLSETIFPGRGVGEMSLGDSMDRLKAELGEPESVKPTPGDPATTFVSYKEKLGLAFLVNRSKQVIGFSVLDDRHQTNQGVAVGSSRGSIQSQFGEGIIRGPGNIVYPYEGLGISYEGDKALILYIFKRERQKSDSLLGDFQLLPGLRVGEIRLGMSVDRISQYWGAPSRKVSLVQPQGFTLWEYQDKSYSLILKGDKVDGIVVKAGDTITPEGIKTGSTREEVERAYGQPARLADGYMLYPGKGFALKLVAGVVYEIQVFHPSR